MYFIKMYFIKMYFIKMYFIKKERKFDILSNPTLYG
jgi:hypothetical protein